MSKALLGRSAAELEDWVVSQGQKPFRGRQLHDWLYAKGARSLDDITVLPKAWRSSLQDEGVTIGRLKDCLLYTSPSPRDLSTSRMPSSA